MPVPTAILAGATFEGLQHNFTVRRQDLRLPFTSRPNDEVVVTVLALVSPLRTD